MKHISRGFSWGKYSKKVRKTRKICYIYWVTWQLHVYHQCTKYTTQTHLTSEVSGDINKKERQKRSRGAAVKITVIFADSQSDCSKNMQLHWPIKLQIFCVLMITISIGCWVRIKGRPRITKFPVIFCPLPLRIKTWRFPQQGKSIKIYFCRGGFCSNVYLP